MKKGILAAIAILIAAFPAAAEVGVNLFRAARVFDGERMHEGWDVVVEGRYIVYAGPSSGFDESKAGQIFEMDGSTLMPGLIEGHSHMLLHPYNETSWNDQVLKESQAERVLRAANHLRAALEAGVTTMRDLGSEGAGFADVSIRDAIDKGIVRGPRLLVAGKAIVATGSYGPKGFHEGVEVPLGAETADGYDDLVRVVRSQIGRNVDVIKVYADYRWGPDGTAQPTFTQRELETIVEIARSSGRGVVAHAATAEGMKRAILAGVETVEHGDGATPEVYKLMRERNVGLCPTLAAGDAIAQYGGWQKLEAGVTICFGGDVGVYPHGDNVRELEMMVEYGMDAGDALRSATSINADLFHIGDRVGRIRSGMLADIISVRGDPTTDISALRDVGLILRDGNFVKRYQ